MGQESNIARTFDAIGSIITAVVVAIAMRSADFSLRSSSFEK